MLLFNECLFLFEESGTVLEKWIDSVAELSRDAGAAILKIYQQTEIGIEVKSDDSPLTEADLAAHQIIVAGLKNITPDIPVLSEESQQISYAERGQWDEYWLVDPLDGTKEFIDKNGEFTVNIAFISHGVPVFGVVYVPVSNVLYLGYQGETSFAYKEKDGRRNEIRVKPVQETLTVVASRRHSSPVQKQLMQVLERRFEHLQTKNMGSSLKLCLVAEGLADLYPRLAPTSEWDTAAAQAVVEAAGGKVVDSSFNLLRYNTKENILNPHFFVLGDLTYPWEETLSFVTLKESTGK